MSFHLLRRYVFICAFGLFVSNPAQGFVINYIESIDGDLTGAYIGTFDTGTNTVAGDTNFAPADFDSFKFAVPIGLKLLSVSLYHTWTLDPGTSHASIQPDLYDETVSALISDGGIVASTHASPRALFDAVMPLDSGIYNIIFSAFGAIHDAGTTAGWSMSYQWQFNVGIPIMTQVPEPTALALFAFGLVGLGYMSRRRSAQPLCV